MESSTCARLCPSWSRKRATPVVGFAGGIGRVLAGVCVAGFAHAQAPQTFEVSVIDRTTDPATLRVPQCLVGAVLRFGQPSGVIDRGEVGAFVTVTGHPERAYNGLYKITRYTFRRDRDRAVVDTAFEAVCIVTPNPALR